MISTMLRQPRIDGLRISYKEGEQRYGHALNLASCVAVSKGGDNGPRPRSGRSNKASRRKSGAAKEVGASDDPKALDKAVKKVAPAKKPLRHTKPAS
jgi:hypothetical protein